MPKMLFICSGNTCRSPMAAALMKKALKERGIEGWIVSSAGLMAVPGIPASENAKKALLEDHGLKIDDHLSRTVDLSMVAEHDYVIAMTLRHAQWLISRFGQHKDKIYFIGELLSDEVKNAVAEYLSAKDPYSLRYMRLYEEKIKPYEVEDPYGSDLEVYKKVAGQIWQYCCKIADLIKNEGHLPPKTL